MAVKVSFKIIAVKKFIILNVILAIRLLIN